MKKAIWFSRHQPTAEQLTDATRLGFEIVGIRLGKMLGAIEIADDKSAKTTAAILRDLADESAAVALFGVWPTDLLAIMAENAYRTESQINIKFPCYAACNSMRTVEDGKPTFIHRSWKLIGYL